MIIIDIKGKHPERLGPALTAYLTRQGIPLDFWIGRTQDNGWILSIDSLHSKVIEAFVYGWLAKKKKK